MALERLAEAVTSRLLFPTSSSNNEGDAEDKEKSKSAKFALLALKPCSGEIYKAAFKSKWK